MEEKTKQNKQDLFKINTLLCLSSIYWQR